MTGAFVRFQRDGKWQSIEIDQLTEDELDQFMCRDCQGEELERAIIWTKFLARYENTSWKVRLTSPRRRDRLCGMADLSHIVEQLRPLAVPIEQLIPDPANVRRHPEKNIKSIIGSLKTFGQRKPIVVNRRTGTIEAGNGTLEGALELGWAHLAAVYVDDDPSTAAGFSISDNRTSELAEWDFEGLSKQLAALAQEGVDLDALGWADYELEPLLQADWSPPAIEPLEETDSKDDSQPVVINAEQRIAILVAVAAWREREQDFESMDGEIVRQICDEWRNRNGLSDPAQAVASSEMA